MNPTPATFPGELPAALRCGFCQQPIDGLFYRTFKRFACARCAAEAEELARRNEFNSKSFTIAAIAGAGVAVLFAVAWAAIVEITHWQIGIIAIFIGVGIGKTVRTASGKRRGIQLQCLSVILSALSVTLGQFAERLFNAMDIVWIGLAVLGAWNVCKPIKIIVAGPYSYQPKSAADSLQFQTVEPIDSSPPINSPRPA